MVVVLELTERTPFADLLYLPEQPQGSERSFVVILAVQRLLLPVRHAVLEGWEVGVPRQRLRLATQCNLLAQSHILHQDQLISNPDRTYQRPPVEPLL